MEKVAFMVMRKLGGPLGGMTVPEIMEAAQSDGVHQVFSDNDITKLRHVSDECRMHT